MDGSDYGPSCRKSCLHFLWILAYYFPLLVPNATRADAEKEKKKSKTRGVEGGRYDRRPPVFSRNTKNEGKKTPRSMIYMLFTHWANGDDNEIEVTFSYKNKPANFLL